MTKRGYYMQLLVCALQRARRSEPLRALHDAALSLAEEAGAEDADVAGFTVAVAKGLIRQLGDRSQVVWDRKAADPRSATQKLYRLANPEPELDVPPPPRPRLPSVDAARVDSAAKPAAPCALADDERAFYESFAPDAARVLVTVERLVRELREHHARAYQALRGKQA